MGRAVAFGPSELGAQERVTILWIGNIFGAPAEGGELAAAAFGNGASEIGIEVVREIQERRRCGPFLTLKEHGNERGCQHQRGSGLDAVERGQRANAFAGGPIADLVV